MRVFTVAVAVFWSGLLIAQTMAVNSYQEKQTAHPDEAKILIGTWRLVSRSTVTLDGKPVTDPNLGSTPTGYLVYDSSGHVSAQLMRPDRTMNELTNCGVQAGKAADNNSAAVCGYDAYFGTYTLENRFTVAHHLEIAISPADVGKVIRRTFQVDGDSLTISFSTTSPQGQPLTRKLLWKRVN